MFFVIVPFECYAAVECSRPILFEGIICVEGVDEVVSMFLVIIFDSKIIDREGDLNWSCDVLPQSWHVRDLEVSKTAQALSEELVCQDACLREVVDCFAYLKVDKGLMYVLVEIVLVDC